MTHVNALPLVFNLQRVSKEYATDGQRTVAVHDVSLEGRRGQLILLLGPSGSGKTTLLTLTAGLLKPTSGSVELFEKDIDVYSAGELQRLRANRIGFIFQNFLLIDALTVGENIDLVLEFAGQHRDDSRRNILRLLGLFGVDHLVRRFPSNLSQGEKQRVAIARAIANNADLIIADEPTASLETRQGLRIIQLLHNLAIQEERCVLVASHDLRLEEFADVVVRLEDGEIRNRA